MNTQTNSVEKLDSTFLTGPGGLVYEIPNSEAQKYVVTPQRAKELGHLPIIPYGFETGSAQSQATSQGAEASDVEGRHMAPNIYGVMVWHSNCLYGPFYALDGNVYLGIHYHPWGNVYGVLC